MKPRILLLCLLVAVPLILGCPGNRQMDKNANEALWAWVEEQEATGWTITGWPDATAYTGIVLDYRFRPCRLDIAINGDVVNPLHQRNMIEDVARRWRNCYPANMRPRFNLRVTFFDKQMERDFELGYTEIDKNGTLDTHHHRTQDVM